MNPTDFAYSLTRYLSHYLPGLRNLSPNTVLAYRDMFKLMIRFAEVERKISPEKLTLSAIDAVFVEDFLAWLEATQGSSIATRNQRLAAIHAFFQYLQREKPEMMVQCQQIIAIKMKKTSKPTVNYLKVDIIKQLLAVPDTNDKFGFRDSVLLGLLYDTGSRVSEIIELRPLDLHLKTPASVSVTGKGRKTRQCPISLTLAENITAYLEVWGLTASERAGSPLFVNHKGEKISRAGVTYILKKYMRAIKDAPPKVSPHVLRHSKAVHLLEAGVNLVYIRDQLGHEKITSTQVYLKTNPEMRRAAFAKAARTLPEQEKSPAWIADNNLLNYLNSLGK